MAFAIHWHESAMDLHMFPILISPPASLSIPSLWVFPVHQSWALVSCIQPGLVICFTLDGILVSILFSQKIPFKKGTGGTSPVVRWLGLCAPNAGGLGSIPGQGTRSHMLQLKILHATIKTRCSQINKFKKKELEAEIPPLVNNRKGKWKK